MKWFFSPPFLSVSPFLLLNLASRQSYAYAIGLYTRPEIKSWSDVKFCAHAQCVLPRCCVVQAKWIDREGLGKPRTWTRSRSTYIHVHFSRNMNFEKIIISLLGWLASRGIIEVKVTDNDKKNCTKFTWYLNFHQNLRSPHHLTSVGKSPELSWQGCRPLRCLVCYCSLISETDSRSASFIRL